MSICINSCSQDLIAHLPDFCGDIKIGDVPNIGIIFCKEAYDDIMSDPDNVAKWEPYLHTSQGGTATDYNSAIIIKNIGVELTSEVAFVDNLVSNGITQVKRGTTYNLTIQDPSVSCANQEFYKLLDSRFGYLVLAYRDGRFWISEERMQFFVTEPSIVKNEQQFFSITSEQIFGKNKGFECFETLGAVEDFFLGK